MKNIDTAFRYIRMFSVCVIVGCVSICCFSVYKSFRLVSDMQQKVYILVNGKALEAYGSDRKDNIPVEARDHVRAFHRYFFTFDPDEKVIRANMAKALAMADASAKQEYDNLKERNYYANVIAGNISQSIDVDSVAIDIDSSPYRFKCFATQHIIRSTSITDRTLVTEGYLRNVSRSDDNPHGFLIERWTTLENIDLKTESR